MTRVAREVGAVECAREGMRSCGSLCGCCAFVAMFVKAKESAAGPQSSQGESSAGAGVQRAAAYEKLGSAERLCPCVVGGMPLGLWEGCSWQAEVPALLPGLLASPVGDADAMSAGYAGEGAPRKEAAREPAVLGEPLSRG